MAQKKTKKKQAKEKSDIASERVDILFRLADEAALSGDLDGADEYIQQARRIAMKSNLRILKECKRRFCKYCYCYLLPSVTSQVRLNPREHRVEVKCLKCMRVSFYPFVREVKERRKK
ncbi:MAG: ribonuclease P [Candidatus Altiarchaeota archaeon]|nr:ribonuclease P [Candidatus Altiarchaeota archaeon]